MCVESCCSWREWRLLWTETEGRGRAVWDCGWEVVMAREDEFPSGYAAPEDGLDAQQPCRGVSMLQW